jgi:hypothetical protein
MLHILHLSLLLSIRSTYCTSTPLLFSRIISLFLVLYHLYITSQVVPNLLQCPCITIFAVTTSVFTIAGLYSLLKVCIYLFPIARLHWHYSSYIIPFAIVHPYMDFFIPPFYKSLYYQTSIPILELSCCTTDSLSVSRTPWNHSDLKAIVKTQPKPPMLAIWLNGLRLLLVCYCIIQRRIFYRRKRNEAKPQAVRKATGALNHQCNAGCFKASKFSRGLTCYI